MAKKQGVLRAWPLTYKLPAHLVREVGRIIVHWANFEYRIQMTIWLLLDVSPKEGRIAVKDPRVEDRLDMIEDLAYLRGISIRKTDLKTLKKTVSQTVRFRDLLAHSIWTTQHGMWHVQRTKGHYEFAVPHSKSRRIDPEGAPRDGRRLLAEGGSG